MPSKYSVYIFLSWFEKVLPKAVVIPVKSFVIQEAELKVDYT